MPDLFQIAPYLIGAWLLIVGGGFFLWLSLSLMWLIREENLEDDRRDREDAEVEYLESIPLPGGGGWEMTL